MENGGLNEISTENRKRGQCGLKSNVEKVLFLYISIFCQIETCFNIPSDSNCIKFPSVNLTHKIQMIMK